MNGLLPAAVFPSMLAAGRRFPAYGAAFGSGLRQF